MRKETKIIISLCFVVLVANLVSVIVSIVGNMPIDSIDVLSILVTIILGISAIVQAEQENKKLDYQTKLQIQNNTPYLLIDGINCNNLNTNDWHYEDCQAINKARFEDPLDVKEDKIFMVSYDVDEGTILNMDFVIQNISDSLISYINPGIIKEAVFYDNKYKSAIQRCFDTLQEIDGYAKVAEKLKKQSYDKLITNDITNISKDMKKNVAVAIKMEHLENDITEVIKKGEVPDTLIFNVRFNMYSVVDIWYQQNFKFGLRLKGQYMWKNQKDEISNVYKRRYAYVLEKCVSNVECVSDECEIKKLNKKINLNW